jgi:hypothetical protein
MPNPLRGELELKLGDETFKLVPSLRGLIEVEERAGCTLFEIADRITKSKSTTTKQAIAVVYGGVIGGLDPKVDEIPDFEEFAEKVLAAGLVQVMPAVLTFVGSTFQARQKKTEP